jgi:hypothetical protein
MASVDELLGQVSQLAGTPGGIFRYGMPTHEKEATALKTFNPSTPEEMEYANRSMATGLGASRFGAMPTMAMHEASKMLGLSGMGKGLQDAAFRGIVNAKAGDQGGTIKALGDSAPIEGPDTSQLSIMDMIGKMLGR